MFQGIFKSKSAVKLPGQKINYIFGTGSIPTQIKTAQLATFADGTTKQQGYQVAEVNKLISTMLTGWDANGNKPKSMSDNYLELILSCDNGFVVKKRLQFPHIIAWQNDSTPYNIADVYKEFSVDNWLKADDFENPDITLVVEPTDEILTTSTATPPEVTTTNSGRFYLYYRNLPVGVNRVHIDFHIKTKTEPIDFDLEIADGMSWKDAQTILASNAQAKLNVLLSTVKDVYKYTGAEGNFEDITMQEWSALYQQIISLNPNNKFTHDLFFVLYETEITEEIEFVISQDKKNINKFGVITDDENYVISQEIDLKKNAVIKFTALNTPNFAVLASATDAIPGAAYKVLLLGDNYLREYKYVSTIDQKVVICGYKGYVEKQIIIIKYSKFDYIDAQISENKESIDKNTKCISSLNSEIGSVLRPTESVITPATESNYFISKEGIKIQISSNAFNLTEPISVNKGEILSAIFGSQNTVASFSKYNSDGTYTVLDSSINSLNAETHIIEVNEDCEIVISFYRANGLNDVKVIKASTIDDLKKRTYILESDFSAIKKTQNDYLQYAVCRPLFIGDSLTEGALPTSSWGDKGVAVMKENFPYIFSRMIGAVIKNEGHSGYSASNWWLDYVSTTGSYVDIHDSKEMNCRIINKPAFNEYDTIFIWLGTNYGYTDTLDTDVNPYTDYNDFANTETGFLCKIIAKIKEVTHGESLIVLSKIFVTKSDGLDPTTSNIVIEKIAQKYGCLLVDNSDLSYANHPELHMNINNPHFGKAGNLFLAKRYIKELYSYFSEDVSRCEFGIS